MAFKKNLNQRYWYWTELQAFMLPILLGTGMAGQALRNLGFTSIHASDMSTQILEQAKQKVRIYLQNFYFASSFTMKPDFGLGSVLYFHRSLQT